MDQFNLHKLQDELQNAVSFVVDDIKEKFKQINQGPTVLDSLRAFIAAVDWTERWIIALLAVHGILLVLAITTRRNQGIQAAIFCCIMVVVYNAERINGLAAKHWQQFSKQHYFDSHGIFTSALLSGPLLLIMFVILVNYLIATCRLLIDMKRKELLYKARQKRKAERGAGSNEPKKDK